MSRSPPQPKTTVTRPRPSSATVAAGHADEGRRGAEQRVEAVGCVGEVHHHREGLPGVDDLEAPGNAHRPAETRGDDAVRDPERRGGTGGRQGVGHVELAAEAEVHVVASPDELGSVRSEVAHVGVAEAEAVGRHEGRIGEEPTMGTVEVDHGTIQELGGEESRFRLEVGLHGAVEVEVVAPEVGEDPHGEPRPVHPVQRQGVGGHLHGHRPDALVPPCGEAPLQVGSLRGGASTGERPQHLGARAGLAEDVRHQVRRGGLAVRPGHADDDEIDATDDRAGSPRRSRWRPEHRRRRPARRRPAGPARSATPQHRRRWPRPRSRGRPAPARARSRRASPGPPHASRGSGRAPPR